jgi:hypothetical protein
MPDGAPQYLGMLYPLSYSTMAAAGWDAIAWPPNANALDVINRALCSDTPKRIAWHHSRQGGVTTSLRHLMHQHEGLVFTVYYPEDDDGGDRGLSDRVTEFEHAGIHVKGTHQPFGDAYGHLSVDVDGAVHHIFYDLINPDMDVDVFIDTHNLIPPWKAKALAGYLH